MQTVIMGIVNIIFTLVAIFTVDRFGRKPLLIIGSIGMAVGAFAVAMCESMAIKGVLPVLSIIVYAAFFMMSWGPICWVLISRHCMTSVRCLHIAYTESSVSLPLSLFGVGYPRLKGRRWKI